MKIQLNFLTAEVANLGEFIIWLLNLITRIMNGTTQVDSFSSKIGRFLYLNIGNDSVDHLEFTPEDFPATD